MKNEKTSCENCAFFRQHFSFAFNSYHPVNCGHCIMGVKSKDNRRFPCSTVCEQWEPKDDIVAKRKERVADSLITLAKRADEILSMINNGYLDI